MNNSTYRLPALAHARGIDNGAPCYHYRQGYGPWVHCRRLPYDINDPAAGVFFDAACTNCA